MLGEDMYTYEVVLRETRLKKVTFTTSRDLNRDQIKLEVARGNFEEDFSGVEKAEILNIEKKERPYVATL